MKHYKYKHWSDYFDAYLECESDRQKKMIVAAFMKRLKDKDMEYECSMYSTYETINGDKLTKYFNISDSQRDLFVKYYINKLFEYYKDEKQFEEYSKKKYPKYIDEIADEYVNDNYSQDLMIEKYICINLYKYIGKALDRLKNPKYFQCQRCGRVCKKNSPFCITFQKYCNECRGKI